MFQNEHHDCRAPRSDIGVNLIQDPSKRNFNQSDFFFYCCKSSSMLWMLHESSFWNSQVNMSSSSSEFSKFVTSLAWLHANFEDSDSSHSKHSSTVSSLETSISSLYLLHEVWAQPQNAKQNCSIQSDSPELLLVPSAASSESLAFSISPSIFKAQPFPSVSSNGSSLMVVSLTEFRSDAPFCESSSCQSVAQVPSLDSSISPDSPSLSASFSPSNSISNSRASPSLQSLHSSQLHSSLHSSQLHSSQLHSSLHSSQLHSSLHSSLLHASSPLRSSFSSLHSDTSFVLVDSPARLSHDAAIDTDDTDSDRLHRERNNNEFDSPFASPLLSRQASPIPHCSPDRSSGQC